MSEPFTGHLRIDERDLDDLLAALRRHDGGDCRRLLDRWAEADHVIEARDDDEEQWVETEPCLDHPLTGWAHREAASHVAGGRFEHALALVEQYRRPLKAADMAARIQLPPPSLFDRSP